MAAMLLLLERLSAILQQDIARLDMSKTATELCMAQQDQVGLYSLVETQQRFLRAWKPDDPRLIEEFERDLFYLIHLAAREATTPIIKQYSEMLSSALMRQPKPIIIPKDTL